MDIEPFESEHEGYMGNWGNTVEHWYHRAAVVLWPRERTFVIRAKTSARWAIGEVTKALKAGNTAQVLALVQRLLPFWDSTVLRQAAPGLLDRTLRIAASIDDSKVSAALLHPFVLTQLTPKALPELCRGLCAGDSQDALELTRWIVAEQWASVRKDLRQMHEHVHAREMLRELTGLCKPILGLIESSLIASQSGLHNQMIEFLTADDADYPVSVQVQLLRTAHENHRRDALRGLGLKPVHARCAQDLATRLNTPARASDDWSIATPVRCSCKLYLQGISDPEAPRPGNNVRSISSPS